MEDFRTADDITQLKACVLAPDEAVKNNEVLAWWKTMCPQNREELFRLSNESRGKMRTLTGMGVDVNTISARRLSRPNHRSNKKRDD